MAAASPPPEAAARVGLLYDERMCAHATPDGKDHPENPERLRAIWRKLNDEGLVSRCVVLTAKKAEDKHIASVHSQDHIKLIKKISSKKYDSRQNKIAKKFNSIFLSQLGCVALKAKEAEDKYIASVHSKSHIKLMKEISSKKYDASRNKIARKFNSIYFNEGSSESALLAAGSVIEVAEKVAAGELSSAIALVRPPGHHAEHDKAMGFCLFNNVAIAANYLLNERTDLGIKKILIVDWDVHHGNATQKMFYDDPRVLSFSVHRFDCGNFYPYEADGSHCFIGEEAGRGYNINVPWEHGECGDADYIAAWDHVLLPVTEAFDPDIILVSAGFDAALGDPLGGCCITPNGYALLLTKLLGFAKGRIVMALEGGYNLSSVSNSVFACAKVLLGDKFTFNSPAKQPFESTLRVIQAARNELKTCWPVLSRPSPSEVHCPTLVAVPLGLSSHKWPDLYTSPDLQGTPEERRFLCGPSQRVCIPEVQMLLSRSSVDELADDVDVSAMRSIPYARALEVENELKDLLARSEDALKVEKAEVVDLKKRNVSLVKELEEAKEKERAASKMNIDGVFRDIHLRAQLNAAVRARKTAEEKRQKAETRANASAASVVRMGDQLQQLAPLADENKHLAAENKRLLDVVKTTLEERLEGEHEDAKRQRMYMERLGSEKQKLSAQLAEAKDELAKVASALKVAVNERNELATVKMFAREAAAILEKERDLALTKQDRLAEEIQLIRENSQRQFRDLKLLLLENIGSSGRARSLSSITWWRSRRRKIGAKRRTST